jgi:hypothetical protein
MYSEIWSSFLIGKIVTCNRRAASLSWSSNHRFNINKLHWEEGSYFVVTINLPSYHSTVMLDKEKKKQKSTCFHQPPP